MKKVPGLFSGQRDRGQTLETNKPGTFYRSSFDFYSDPIYCG
jgi:hypothetical protein